MKKVLLSILLCFTAQNSFAASANIPSDCSIEKAVRISFKASAPNKKISDTMMKSVVNVLEKRISALNICHKPVTYQKDQIIVELSEFEAPNQIVSFLSEQVKFSLKEHVFDKDGNPIIKNNDFLWQDAKINENLITSSTVINRNKKEYSQIKFSLTPEGIDAYDELYGMELNDRIILEVNGKDIPVAIIEESLIKNAVNLYQIAGTYISRTSKNEITLNYMNPEDAEKFDKKNVIFRFKEFVKDPVSEKIQMTGQGKDAKYLFKDSILQTKMIKSFSTSKQIEPLSNQTVNEPIRVRVNLDEKGRKELELLTISSLGKSVGIELNKKIISAPVIQEVISLGTFDLTLNDEKDAKELSAQLNSGNPVANLSVVEIKSL